MDKEWMCHSRESETYVVGVDMFLNFAFRNVVTRWGEILCPCRDCVNGMFQSRIVCRDHLIIRGFMPNYTVWRVHGEALASSSVQNENDNEPEVAGAGMHGMVNDIFVSRPGDPSVQVANFYKYMNDAEQPLYPECKTETKLSFIVWLFNLKCVSKWTDKSFNLLLGKLKQILPDGETLPANLYETKKMIGDLGFSYKKIDACPNDCMLYWKEDSKLDLCKVCNKSRWKTVRGEARTENLQSSTGGNNVAVKQLRYFPIKPRLQRLFMSPQTAKSMTWFHDKRRKDGVLRHPADSKAWENFDNLHPAFALDPRNVRLGLSTDGMDPYNHGSSHSIWPVTLVVYNLPPWMCLQQRYFMMPVLIPGPTSPGNDIDVYLRPLVEELKILFDGVETYDASSKTNFTMRVALLWTISDFPAYAVLAGYSTKGKLACLVCQGDTRSCRLRGKECYMAHRSFLDPDHKYRFEKQKFNGECEYRPPPALRSGFDVLEEVDNITVTFGKTSKSTVSRETNWRKKSIFFELSYWRTHLHRHNLDEMHIEKNVCDNLLGTLLGVKGKTKDTLKARLDMKDMNIRRELHPIEVGDDKYKLPAASFTMSKNEKKDFLNVLKNVKVPDGYSSNISRCVHVKEGKMLGLKSHDCHILMHQLLPIALRGALPLQVCSAVIDLCRFFKELWYKNYTVQDFERLNKKIALILCRLEMIFPPSFFDIMVHLPIHLAQEAMIAGPVQYRQMYPFERYMFKIKGYIRCKSRPEGSIAEGLLAEECLTFCSMYLEGNHPVWNQNRRNEDGYTEEVVGGIPMFQQKGRFLGAPLAIALDAKDKEMAHRYVLFNCDELEVYRSTFKKSCDMKLGRRKKKPTPWEVDNALKKEFPKWFTSHVNNLWDEVSEEIQALARGPNGIGRRGSGYLINGYRFHTESLELKRKTQNSGVYVLAATRGYSSSRDANPAEDVVEYFGVLEDIIQLDYFGVRNVVLFKCKWYDSVNKSTGITTDAYGFTLVNSKKFAYKDEPFVLASQVEQLFYVDDPRDHGWRVVVQTRPRDFCENAEAEADTEEEILFPSDPHSGQDVEHHVENMTWVRNDVEAEIIHDQVTRSSTRKQMKGKSVNLCSKRRRLDIFIDEDDVQDKEDEIEEDKDEDMEIDDNSTSSD